MPNPNAIIVSISTRRLRLFINPAYAAIIAVGIPLGRLGWVVVVVVVGAVVVVVVVVAAGAVVVVVVVPQSLGHFSASSQSSQIPFMSHPLNIPYPPV